MANPLFQALGGVQMPGQMGQFQNMVQQFRQFQQTFQGDPKAEVEKLVQSGKITQQQLNQLQQVAGQFRGLTKMVGPHCRYSKATRRGNRPAAIFNRVEFGAFRKE